MSDILSYVSRWLHILPAIALVGGTMLMRWVVLPAAAALNDEQRQTLRDQLRGRWARLTMISVTLLLLSGLYNAAMKAINFQLDPLYNGLLGVKILLALAIFYLSSVLAGRSATAERFREKETFWLNLTLTLAVILVCIAGVMRMGQYEPKQRGDGNQQTLSQIDDTTQPAMDK